MTDLKVLDKTQCVMMMGHSWEHGAICCIVTRTSRQRKRVHSQLLDQKSSWCLGVGKDATTADSRTLVVSVGKRITCTIKQSV